MFSGVSYVQESTFGTGQKEQQSEATAQEAPKRSSNPQLDGKVDQAHPEKIEDFIRSQNASKPPAELQEMGKDKGEGEPQAS